VNKAKPKIFSRLFFWELEGNLTLPFLSLIIASAIIAVLSQQNVYPDPMSYINLYSGAINITFFLTFVACILFSHSFAGSFGRGELKRMLSYPVKRWQVFLSKVMALNIILFSVYTVVYALNFYLNPIGLLEPLFYVSLFVMFLQLLLVSAVSVCVSMITKSELISILATFLLFLGLDNALDYNSIFYSVFSSAGRLRYIFGYFEQITRDSWFFVDPITLEQASVSMIIPFVIAVVVLLASFIYFTRKLEVD
jgi:ABC-type transport system involved in multi-copper enzyme maturation permease subunit